MLLRFKFATSRKLLSWDDELFDPLNINGERTVRNSVYYL